MGPEKGGRSFPAPASPTDTEVAMAAARVLERIFSVFFLVHILIILFIDMQPLMPGLYPPALRQILTWFTTTFKDPVMGSPEPWLMSFLYTEAFGHLFFCPVAAYAFWKGNCKWIRTPAIIYVTQLVTIMVAALAQFLFADFSNAKVPSPQTLQERLTISALYSSFLVIPLLMLLFVLFDPAYQEVEKMKKK